MADRDRSHRSPGESEGAPPPSVHRLVAGHAADGRVGPGGRRLLGRAAAGRVLAMGADGRDLAAWLAPRARAWIVLEVPGEAAGAGAWPPVGGSPPGAGAPPRRVRAAAAALPFADACFDAAVGRLGALRPPGAPGGLAELRRVLRGDGRLALLVDPDLADRALHSAAQAAGLRVVRLERLPVHPAAPAVLLAGLRRGG